MRAKIQYIIGISLILFYIFILSLSFFNRASEDYNISFVNRKLTNYPNEGLEYALDYIVKYRKDGYVYKNLGAGWSHIETNFVWGISEKKYLYYAIEKNELNQDLFFFIKVGAFLSQDLRIYVNGKYIDTINLEAEDDIYVVKLSSSIFSDESPYKEKYYIQEICLETNEGVSPYELGANSDTRKLNIRLYKTMISQSSDIGLFEDEN